MIKIARMNVRCPFRIRWFAILTLFLGVTSVAYGQILPFDQANERADQGDAFAQAVVAIHYQLGWETEKDTKQAANYALASAKARHALGYFRVGTMIRNGEGFAKDEKK
jgi:TPR repeat protein